MQTDPIGYGDGPNWYNYVGGDPVNSADATGMTADEKPTKCNDGCGPVVVGRRSDTFSAGTTFGSGRKQNPSGGNGGAGIPSPAAPATEPAPEEEEQQEIVVTAQIAIPAPDITSDVSEPFSLWRVFKFVVTRPFVMIGAILSLCGDSQTSCNDEGDDADKSDDSDLKDKPPVGSKPISETPWTRKHGEIKKRIGAGPRDSTYIDRANNVWSQQPGGKWENYGPAGDYVGSGKP